MRNFICLAAALLFSSPASSTSAQSASDLIGRDVRVFVARDSAKGVAGVVTHATDTFLRINTAMKVCSVESCSNSLSAPWNDVTRVQVNSQSRRERIAKVALIGGASGALLTLGIRHCQGSRRRLENNQEVGGRTTDQIDTCKVKVTGFTIAAAFVGFWVTRPTWEDMPLPIPEAR